jgi:hypothetical protein
MLAGYITLTIFVVVLTLTLMRKINLPVQTVLVLITLANVLVGAAFYLFTDGWKAVMLVPNELLGNIILHPITALLAGLFMGGVLAASGGFEAMKAILDKLSRTPIGLAGTMALLVMLPLIAALPCGRILGAAILPLLFAFGPEGMKLLNRSQLIVLVGAFARNAFGSCGPSPIGGVGQIGEGFLGSYFPTAAEGILRAPQAFSLIIGTAFTALFLKFITQMLYPGDVSIKEAPPKVEEAKQEKVTATGRGYTSLIIFFASLLVAIFQPFGKMPVQTVLVIGALLIIPLCRVKLTDLMGGIILMPATAMIAGFMAAGTLAFTGGFTVLGSLFKYMSDGLGVALMLAFFVQMQTILPLSCSRILTAALVPVLYLFGPAGFALLNWPQLAIVMSAYMINATTSCGPSPLGGAGMMAEGTLRAETGYLKAALSFASMAVMAPLAAMFMRFVNLQIFQSTLAPITGYDPNLMMLMITLVVVVAVYFVLIRVLGLMLGKNLGVNWTMNFIGFLVAGAISGAMLSFALFMDNPDLLNQMLLGAGGGSLAALLIAAMIPRAQNPAPAEPVVP